METKELIHKRIKDILVWSVEDGGVDESEVFIKLDNDKTVRIPWDFADDDLEDIPPADAKSLFDNMVGDKVNFFKGQEIVDVLILDNAYSGGFLELENGFIIYEIMVSPHGLGGTGLHYFENIHAFEDKHGTKYKRLSACD